MGGFDGSRQLASVERYDTEIQVWDSVAPIKIARSALSLTVLDGKLWCMGGFDGHSFLSIVELYDPAVDKWEESSPLTSGRSGHASAVIYQPSCVNQYMDCVEEQIDRDKKSPEDDENKPGPSNSGGPSTSKSPSQTSNSTSQLHAFSGNRCTHCDDEKKNETEQERIDRRITRKESSCTKYEQMCREAIHSLIKMDNEEKITTDQCQNYDVENISDCNRSGDGNTRMDISDDETSDYDSFDVDNPKKFRRREVLPPYVDSEMSESSNSMSENSLDSSSANNIIPGQRNRLKARCNESGQCSLSRLKNKVRQNICDFVSWSVSSPLPKAIPQDSNSNNLTNLSNIPNGNGTTEERKCDLLRKYYKCKMKYCNNSK